jgi:hypothetical protein
LLAEIQKMSFINKIWNTLTKPFSRNKQVAEVNSVKPCTCSSTGRISGTSTYGRPIKRPVKRDIKRDEDTQNVTLTYVNLDVSQGVDPSFSVGCTAPSQASSDHLGPYEPTSEPAIHVDTTPTHVDSGRSYQEPTHSYQDSGSSHQDSGSSHSSHSSSSYSDSGSSYSSSSYDSGSSSSDSGGSCSSGD